MLHQQAVPLLVTSQLIGIIGSYPSWEEDETVKKRDNICEADGRVWDVEHAGIFPKDMGFVWLQKAWWAEDCIENICLTIQYAGKDSGDLSDQKWKGLEHLLCNANEDVFF